MLFKKVLITNIKDRSFRFECDSIEEYNKYLKNHPDMAEIIGGFGQQIKPVLDVDAYETDINIDEVIADIKRIFPNKVIFYAKREPREYKEKGMKYSYRFYVDEVRINYKR